MDQDEKELKDALAEELGVEFCTEEELAEEIKKAKQEPTIQKVERKISASEIIERCNEACGKMSRTNPHRFLLFLCATMIRELIDQLEESKKASRVH